MENLVHLIYASKETTHFTEDMIVDLLEQARANNSELNVSGMLVYSEGSFFQVLEGEEAVVNALFEKIEQDERHTGTVKIICEAIAERGFSDWTMGYVASSSAELSKVAGMNDFFTGRACLADLDEGRAKLLLNSFAEGRWRLAG